MMCFSDADTIGWNALIPNEEINCATNVFIVLAYAQELLEENGQYNIVKTWPFKIIINCLCLNAQGFHVCYSHKIAFRCFYR